MRFSISFCTFFFVAYIGYVCTSENLPNEEVFNDGAQEMTIEERGSKYLTNRQIRNKFTRQWSKIKELRDKIKVIETSGGGNVDLTALKGKVSTAETDITNLKSNQEKIGDSLQTKCEQLDRLMDALDTDKMDCCKTDFVVMCISQAVSRLDSANNANKFAVDAQGVGTCKACPAGMNIA